MTQTRTMRGISAVNFVAVSFVALQILTSCIAAPVPTSDTKHEEAHKSSTTHSQHEGMKSPQQSHRRTYMIEADELNMQPVYEQSVNPFLFHLEQGWRLKPIRHRYQKKKGFQPQPIPPIKGAVEELPVDPSKPHFMDSNEAADVAAEENRAFGEEEKDLKDLFDVLFSSDY